MSILLRILGVLDLLTAVGLALFETGLVPFWIVAPLALDLLIKGILFRTGAASAVDFGIAIYILLMPLLGFWVVSTVLAVYLGQKGLFSLL
jgi:hypothetical protein